MKDQIEKLSLELLKEVELSPFKGPHLDEIRAQINNVATSCIKLVDGEDKLAQEQIPMVSKWLDTFFGVFFEVPITKEFAMFIEKYCFLIKSWNESSVKDKYISDAINRVEAIYRMRHSLEDLFYMTKRLFHRIEALEKIYMLPTIEFTKMYLDSLRSKE
jgi:hypothetical protein